MNTGNTLVRRRGPDRRRHPGGALRRPPDLSVLGLFRSVTGSGYVHQLPLQPSCDYCCVSSSPSTLHHELGAERIAESSVKRRAGE